MDARTRSLDSRTEESQSPTISTEGNPGRMDISTNASTPSMPFMKQVNICE
jgi:hypothetical protein